MKNKNESLIEYKENIFTKIKNFFFKLFNKNKIEKEKIFSENPEVFDVKEKNIREELKVYKNEEKERILNLKKGLDNKEISEEDIEDEDIEALIELYKEETKKLNQDTFIRKNNIQKLLIELKENNKAV